MHLKCWHTPCYQQQSRVIVERLKARGLNVECCEVELINSKFLRLNPELALLVDAQGLSLCANGMKMQPDWVSEIGRLKRASLKTEILARACQANEQPKLIDATAGLGHDTLLMAKFGAKITLIERHPILYSLLEDAHLQAQKNIYLAPIVKNIDLVFSDSTTYLKKLTEIVDVIYLDPMFPQRDAKQAQVKKQMQILHLLLPENGEMDLGDGLLEVAKPLAKRVIVKRPRHAVYLNNDKPQHQWLGDACRFDAYFKIV